VEVASVIDAVMADNPLAASFAFVAAHAAAFVSCWRLTGEGCVGVYIDA